ncbi:MAG TPA: hypothetical protein VEI97_09795, partial [bacterium]|nr:hypothetical protein [bacterium]
MRKFLRRPISGVCLAALAALGLSCSNSGSPEPVIPNPQDPGTPGGLQGVGIDFTPFEDLRGDDSGIIDIAFEADGDVVVFDGAWKLYTAGGVFKRTLEGGPTTGLANNDSGRGMSGISGEGAPFGVHDDAFVEGGDNTVAPNGAWYGGEPDPNQTGCSCSVTAQWQAAGVSTPHGFEYHRVTGRPFWRVDARALVLDNNPDGGAPCNLPIPRFTPNPPWGGILVYHPQAPF